MVETLRSQHGAKRDSRAAAGRFQALSGRPMCTEDTLQSVFGSLYAQVNIGDPDNIMEIPDTREMPRMRTLRLDLPGNGDHLVDKNYDSKKKLALVVIPGNAGRNHPYNDKVTLTGFEGEIICSGKIVAMRNSECRTGEACVCRNPVQKAAKVAGIRIRSPEKKKRRRQKRQR